MELKDLPYVNGLPAEGQQRINWIKDGEPLDGASTKYGFDGELNRGPNQVQANVVVLDENIRLIAKSTIDNTAEIATINSILSVSENVDAMAQIGKNTKSIEKIDITLAENKVSLDDLDTRVTTIEPDIGTYNPALDTLYRPIRNDLYWIKKEMGQYPGQDINGQSVQGTEAIGMKRRIIDNSSAIVRTTERVSLLEEQFHDSDVGSLTTEVTSLRNEMGPKSAATADQVYTRLNRMNTSIGSLSVSMEDVMDSIGLNQGVSSIITIVSQNTSNINTNNDRLIGSGGVISRLDIIEQQIGVPTAPTTINGKIKTNTDSINSLYQIVGADTSSGLRSQVAWINQVVGIVPGGTQPPQTSLIFKMNSIEQQQSAMNDSIQDLQVEIGNNNEGLKGQVLRLSNQMNGTNPSSPNIETAGVLNTLNKHQTRINQLESAAVTYIPEAPRDGKAYVRKDGAWVDLETLLP